MLVVKKPVFPERVRQTPEQFSWVDHRLAREFYIDNCSHAALALYLFLVTVADAQGLSYYSDVTLQKRLKMEPGVLEQSRHQLIQLGLIAYQKPIYQVLPLSYPAAGARRFEKNGAAATHRRFF